MVGGHFLGRFKVDLVSNGKVRLEESIGYYDYATGNKIIQPAGAISDGASIPRYLWPIIGHPLSMKYIHAALIHDMAVYILPWDEANELMYDIMSREHYIPTGEGGYQYFKKVKLWRRKAMYYGIKLYGHFRRSKK